MRIAISGLGVVSPIGIGREAFWAALSSGRSGVGEVNLFDASSLRTRAAAQVVNFDGPQLLGAKGLRYVDRPSQFALAAAGLAIADAGIDRERMQADRWGVVLGTAFGGQSSLEDANRERAVDGPQWMSPAKFPNTPINAMSYQIPIRQQMRLINTTVSSGMNSGLDAMFYATTVLNRVRDGVVVCGGVDELSRNAYYSCHFAGELAGLSGPAVSCPFDRRRNGYVLGEGAAMSVLEMPDALARRGGAALAELRGFGSATAAPDAGRDVRIDVFAAAMRRALDDAGIAPEEVDYVAAGANGSEEGDAIEAQAIGRVFGSRSGDLPVGAVKSMTGEAYGASGGFQTAAAVLALNRGTLTQTINLDQPDPECRVASAERSRPASELRHVLVSSLDRYGRAVCWILGRAA
jgi:3-oxoacyl-[acyl-carrier-protein] synthase II